MIRIQDDHASRFPTLACMAKGSGGGKGGGGGKGNGGNWPSTTGNPSGGGRGNAPPSK